LLAATEEECLIKGSRGVGRVAGAREQNIPEVVSPNNLAEADRRW
jgi:hypothetical protein